MSEYIPYEIRTGHPADFEVQYEILQPSITGERRELFPGIRCDFLYEGDNPGEQGMWMIWPEFLDENGNAVTDVSRPVEPNGKAKMWILRPETRTEPHQKRIPVGVKGYFMTGPHKLANVTVTKILALFSNPVESK